MPNYYLGIDVGGTKTQALIADGDGNILGLGRAGAGNHEGVGYEGLKKALQESTQLALDSAGIDRLQIAGAGFGVAGYDWPSELPDTLEAIATLGLECPVRAVNDTVIGLVAGAEAGWGVALVAGTGCNCWGRSQTGREGRVTGNGGTFGEYGGAGEIVGKVIQAVAHAHFQRGPQTHLTQLLIETCGAKDPFDLLEGLVLEWYQIGASLAPKVFETAYKGDPVAKEIIRWAGNELGEMAAGVIRQLEIEAHSFEVVLVGSVFDGGPMLLEPLHSSVWQAAPRARFVRLNAPPVIGAVLLGMEAGGLDTPSRRPALIASFQEPAPSEN